MIPNHTVYCALPRLTKAVGGVTRDMCACIVRQDYTGAHFHALGWTSPQRLFILRLLSRERCPKFKITRQILQCSSLWNFFQPLQFAIKSAPSMSSLFNLLLSFEKESTLLLIASVINKLSTLSAPSMIDFFFKFNLSNTTKHILLDSLLQEVRVTEFQIATCLIWLSLYCLIHFS